MSLATQIFDARIRESAHPQRVSWPLTAHVLLSLIAYGFTEAINLQREGTASGAIKGWVPTIAASLAIALTWFFNGRLYHKRVLTWLLRTVVYALAAVYAFSITRNLAAAYYMNFLARVLGYCFIAESAIQHWLMPERNVPRGAYLVFLGSIIFVLASRISSTIALPAHHIRYFAMPFAVLLAVSMRAARHREPSRGRSSAPWVLAVAIAVLLGGSLAIFVAQNAGIISRIVMSIIRPRRETDVGDPLGHPLLAHSLSMTDSDVRTLKVEGQLAEHHLRGRVFEIYLTNGAWGAVSESRGSLDAGLLRALPGGERITVSPLGNTDVLYVPLHMAGLDAPDHKIQWAANWGGPVYASPRKDGELSYQVAIAGADHRGPLVQAMNPEILERSLELPEDIDPLIQTLADTISKDLTNTHDKMEAVRQYLWKNHSYSLHIDPKPGDPVVDFLDRKLDGHCQYFATATVLLLRAMGVPARYTTGYYVHESPEPNTWIVRQRDAHAWAEVWTDKDGWSTFDTTPSSGMPGQSGRIGWWPRLLEKLADWGSAFGIWLRDAPFEILAVIVSLIVIGLFIIHRRRVSRAKRKTLRPPIEYVSAGAEFEDLASAFNAYLAWRGAACPSHTPWRDHLARLKSSPDRASGIVALRWDLADEFVTQYASARFGGHASAELIRDLRELIKRLNE